MLKIYFKRLLKRVCNRNKYTRSYVTLSLFFVQGFHGNKYPNILQRTLRSSRSTDAKTSETSVVDDATQPPPNSSPGEQQQQQQQRVYKKANKRVSKKAKRESWDREFSPKNHNLEHRLRKNKTSVFVMKQVHHNSLSRARICAHLRAHIISLFFCVRARTRARKSHALLSSINLYRW